MEASDATIKNEPNGEVAEIKNESEDAKLRWMHTMELNSAKWSRVENGQVVEPEGIIEPSDATTTFLEMR